MKAIGKCNNSIQLLYYISWLAKNLFFYQTICILMNVYAKSLQGVVSNYQFISENKLQSVLLNFTINSFNVAATVL